MLSGTIGLLAFQVAKSLGAGRVLVVDVVQSRLELAKQLGADLTLLVDTKSDPKQNGKRFYMYLEISIDAFLNLDCYYSFITS